MKHHRSYLAVVWPCVAMLWLCACGGNDAVQDPAMPPLPPFVLKPLQPEIEALAATLPKPTEAQQRELAELGDIALQRVEADARIAARAERSLLEHAFAGTVLTPALEHTEVATRRRAAWLCGQSGQSVLQVPLLLRLKYELDPEAVLWVADALQRLGNDEGLAWIAAGMNSETTAQQAGTIAIAIGKERGIVLPDNPTYVQLQAVMNDLDTTWQRTGVGTRPGVAPPASDLEARFAAHLATTAYTPLRPIDDARYVLQRSGKLPVPLLRRALGAEEPYLRVAALQVLANIGACAHEAGPSVLPLLGDPKTDTEAVRTLGEVGCTEAIPHLRARLTAPDSELRHAATQALGLLRDAASTPVFEKMMADPNETKDVRVDAAFALLCIGSHAAAEAYLAEREAKKDYHPPMLAILRDRLKALPR